MEKNKLTTREAAERLEESERLVRLWCQQSKFPNARLVEHPRGDYWLIPARDLASFVKPKLGRVPTPKPNREVLPSGTIINWSERPDRVPSKVAITCHRCQKKSLASLATIRRSNWSGLCSNCIRQYRPKKKLQDEKLPSGSVLRWSEREQGRVPVMCGGCGQTRLVIDHISRKAFSGICMNCRRTGSARPSPGSHKGKISKQSKRR